MERKRTSEPQEQESIHFLGRDIPYICLKTCPCEVSVGNGSGHTAREKIFNSSVRSIPRYNFGDAKKSASGGKF